MRRVATVLASMSRKAGGLLESVRNLTLAVVDQANFDNLVLSLRDEYTEADRAAWKPLDTKVFPVHGPRSFGYAPGLYDALVEGKVDVIHNHGIWMYPSIAVSRYARDRSVPYVISPHGMLDPWAVSNSYWKKVLARAAYERQHLDGAACIRALCESEASAIRAYGLKNPICIIPNGIHMPPADATRPPAWDSSIPAGRKVLLYLGRIHPKKGLRTVIEAWADIVRRRTPGLDDWQLVIAGWDQGGHERQLQSLARTLGCESSIVFPGPQFGHDRHATYRRAQAFVLASLGEGMPMVVLEAWSHGLPALMTEECNLPVGFEREAALRMATDRASVVRAIETLLGMSEAQRVEMGKRGRELVETQFDWAWIGAEMGRVYEWLLGAAPAPPSMWG